MFYYTDFHNDVDSTAVRKVYFNGNDGEAVIVLHSGGAYQYSHLTVEDFHALTTGTSPGTHYATRIKGKKGPGKSINPGPGFFKHVSEVGREAADVPEAAVGTPKGLTYAAGATIDGVKSGNETRTTLGLEPVKEIRGSGFALNDAGLTVNSVSSLFVPRQPRTHVVKFAFVAGNTEHTHTVKVISVDEAVKAVQDAAEALGLKVTVKEVTVKFE